MGLLNFESCLPEQMNLWSCRLNIPLKMSSIALGYFCFPLISNSMYIFNTMPEALVNVSTNISDIILTYIRVYSTCYLKRTFFSFLSVAYNFVSFLA